MSVFSIETSAVQGAADSIKSLASSLESLSDSVNGYDTSQSGGDSFNFDGAKAVISENIKAASIKVKNTATYMTKAEESHTRLQNSLKYGEDAKAAEEANSKSSNNGGYTPSASSGNYSPGSSSGGYSPGASYSPGGAQRREKEEKEKSDYHGIIPILKGDYETDDSKKKEISKLLAGILLAPLTDILKDESLEELEVLYEIKYSEEGFAQVGDRYVVTCDESYGEVGDMIDLKQKDGSYVKCIIGGTEKKQEEYKNNITFLTEKEVKDKNIITTTEKIQKETTNVYNAGPDKENLREGAKKTISTPDNTTDTTETTTTEPSTNSAETGVNTDTNINNAETNTDTEPNIADDQNKVIV